MNVQNTEAWNVFRERSEQGVSAVRSILGYMYPPLEGGPSAAQGEPESPAEVRTPEQQARRTPAARAALLAPALARGGLRPLCVPHVGRARPV